MHIVFDDFSPLIKDNETLKTVPDLYLNLSLALTSVLEAQRPKKATKNHRNSSRLALNETRPL